MSARALSMSILSKYEAAFESGDKEQLDAVIHDDCKFYPHVGGAVMTKGDIMAFAGTCAVRTESHRILFENDGSVWVIPLPTSQTDQRLRPCWRFTDSKTGKSSMLKRVLRR